jgi:hypothetical protein
MDPTYYEFDGNQMISKIAKMVLSPSKLIATCYFSKCEIQHQIDQMFHPFSKEI